MNKTQNFCGVCGGVAEYKVDSVIQDESLIRLVCGDSKCQSNNLREEYIG